MFYDSKMRIDISVYARLNQVKSSSIVLSSQNDNQLNTWKLCRHFVMSKLVEHDRNIVDILAVAQHACAIDFAI